MSTRIWLRYFHSYEQIVHTLSQHQPFLGSGRCVHPKHLVAIRADEPNSHPLPPRGPWPDAWRITTGRGLARIVIGILITPILLRADDPNINPEFPVDERSISPPSVGKPIHECARAVYVENFIGKALVRVFADGVEVGKGTSKLGYGDISLTRPLRLRESITATQTVRSVTSGPSDPVSVEKYPKLTTPVVTKDVYACGRIVRVENLVASTHVEVRDLDAPGTPVIGTAENTGTVASVFTSPLAERHRLQAVQISCPDTPDTHESPKSAVVRVKTSPNPPPKPQVGPGSVEGVEVLFAKGLLPGAEIEVKANSDVISSGHFANYQENWFPLDKPVPPGHPKITARQKLCSWSPQSDVVFPGTDIGPPRIGNRICEGSRFVSIEQTMPGAIVVLFRRAGGAGSLTAIGNDEGVPGTLQMPVNKFVTLQRRDVVSARQYVGLIVSPLSNEVTVDCGGGFNVITQHNDNFRTGSYLSEFALTPDAVLHNGMQPAFTPVPLQGAPSTQPLYVRELQGANTVFVTTMDNWIYAINASNGTVIWRKRFDDVDRPVARGIDTTPVIDVAANRMYLLFSAAKKPLDFGTPDYRNPGVDLAYWLVALNLANRTEVRTPVAAWVYRDTGKKLSFAANSQIAHPALLLDHGSLYIAFGAFAPAEVEDAYLDKYHGWVMRYRATDLALQSVFCTSPNVAGRANNVRSIPHAPGSGIWHGGGGVAADPDGNVYLLTGNGRVELDNSNYADAFLKLTISAGTLVPSAFVPGPPDDPDPDQLESQDADLGSGGPLVLPGFNFVVGGGKSGWMYLLDRTSMNRQQRLTASTNIYTGERWEHWDTGPHLHGSPSLWQRSGATDLYVWGEKDKLRQFRFDPGTKRFIEPELHGAAVSALPKPMPGGMISISANGSTPHSGVVWATLPIENIEFGDIQCRLYAFAGDDLKPLWDDAYGLCGHWAPPTIADGRVFVVSANTKARSGNLVGYKLGPPGNRTSWPPHQPGLMLTSCASCHNPAQLADLERRWPLRSRFENEASVTALPAIAGRLSSPPDGARKILVLQGNGLRTWRAEDVSHKLTWTVRETTADLTTPAENSHPGAASNATVRVHLGPGWVWTAADGSSLTGSLEKTTPAPQQRDIPWMLFRAQPRGQGVLSGVRYIQLVQTHAGRRPARAPARAGEEIKVPFYAQYWVYQ